MSDAVVIFSGGPDSTAATLWAIEKGFDTELLTFQFAGQKQYGEIFAAMVIARLLNRPHTILDFKSPLDSFSPMMRIMMHAGTPKLGIDKSKPHLMPFGSGVILATASSFAIYNGIYHLIWGATKDDGLDNNEYTQEFANRFASLVSHSLGMEFKITVPFGETHKPLVMRQFSERGELFASTWSCKISSVTQCGECIACVARRASVELAGINDTTQYANMNFALPFALSEMSDISEFTEDDWKKLGEVIILKSPRDRDVPTP